MRPARPGGRGGGRGRELRAARELARLCGIQSGYTDLAGHRVEAPLETLLAALRAFGQLVDGPGEIPAALRERRLALLRRVAEPVTVAWGGRLASLALRVPERDLGRRVGLTLHTEAGTEVDAGRDWLAGAPAVVRSESIDGRSFATMTVPLRGTVPLGYHRLAVRVGRSRGATRLISAPLRAAEASGSPFWGVFLPLYALRSERGWGVGDLGDLEALMEWVSSLGGGIVATLPILAAFLGERPHDRSPYSPASRLFWNELHLDVARVPELPRSPEALAVLRSKRFQEELGALRAAPLVDHRAAMEAKRRVLAALARTFFADQGPRGKAFGEFVRTNPRTRDYAAFRANVERRNDPWVLWPTGEREGRLPRHGGREEAWRYHAYVQWLMAEQLAEVDRRSRELGTRLYFDSPIGVNRHGYDVWRERSTFVAGVSAGAPPDPFFTGGQDWGFPPLHPERVREDGYAYPIECLRHLFRHASVLRLDHVMGFHRLYWVPHGMPATHGLYVRYRPEEWYAILALESSRNGTVIVGEDLGLVPAYVRRAMRRHGLLQSYVLEMELTGQPGRAVRPPPAASLASLNTHDLPPFAAFWDGADLATRLEQGWLDERGLTAERESRRRMKEALVEDLRKAEHLGPGSDAPTTRDALRASLAFLASSEARGVLANLEDLWLERERQNVPGTVDQYPNWRRPARYRLEELPSVPGVTGILRTVNRLRASRGAPAAAKETPMRPGRPVG